MPTIDGKPRKLLGQAARNGFFFVLDRTNGKNLVSKPYVPLNWAKGVDAKGQPIPDVGKEPSTDGSLVTIPGGGGTNWMPPSFDPQTQLFYVNAVRGYSVNYLTDTDPHPEGYGGSGKDSVVATGTGGFGYPDGCGALEPCLFAVAGTTGFGFPGILTTAGKLLFTGDYAANFVAYNPADGTIQWHFPVLSSVTNGPETYMLDGKQYVIVGAGDTLFAFALVQP